MVSRPECLVKPLRYSAFGIYIEADVPLPGLVGDYRVDAPNVRIWLASMPPWARHALTLPTVACRRADFAGSNAVYLLGEAEFFHVRYADGTEFVISHTGDRVFGRWWPPLTLEDTLTYVMGPILGIVLRRQGRTCLHASAVAWKGRAVMFVGSPGAGKSTTAAAAVIRHGARMLTDDIVVLRRLNGKYLIEPGQPWLRLWESSVRLLFGDKVALPLLTPNWDKRYLDASSECSLATSLKLICVLGGLTPPVHDAPVLTSVSLRDALVLLAANTYRSHFSAERRSEFQMLSGLAQIVPAVVVPDDHAARPLDVLLDAVRVRLDGLCSAEIEEGSIAAGD